MLGENNYKIMINVATHPLGVCWVKGDCGNLFSNVELSDNCALEKTLQNKIKLFSIQVCPH